MLRVLVTLVHGFAHPCSWLGLAQKLLHLSAFNGSSQAIALLFEMAGTRTVPPYEPLAYRAVEACGRLPLVLAVAGGILAEAGGRLTEEFVMLLQEDHGEVLREKGDFGDEHVKIEDRLITASLRAYDGAEREEVVALFTSFAIFPEDVPVPGGLFAGELESAAGQPGFENA